MSIRFLLGRAGSGKSTHVLHEIREELKARPDGPPILYIVPDQMTFQQEYALLKDGEVEGSIRAQVLSFSRLAWRVFQEVGGGTKKMLSSTGVQMMLRKIAEERKSDWNVFQKAIEKQGFMEQLETMMTEFKRYRVTPTLLQEQLTNMDRFQHKHPGEQTLQHKLEDMLYIYEHMTEAMSGQYIDNEDMLQLLIDQLEKASFLDGAEIYLDGFHRFTPQELMVIQALMKKATRTSVTLTLDRPRYGDIDELDLFYQTGHTYQVIEQTGQEVGIGVSEIKYLDGEFGRFHYLSGLQHLEHYFNARPAPPYQGEVPLTVAQAVNPRAEVEGVAQEIVGLVRDHGYRYQDMAILIREPEVYHDLIQTVFRDYRIPVFVDEKRTMLNHPLIELLRSALEVIEGNWRYDALFRLLKTDFIPATDDEHPLTQEAIDELENYVLEYGIRTKSRWLSDQRWHFKRFRGFDQASQTDEEKRKEERMNRLRQQVVDALEPLDTKFREARTVRERTVVLFTWLEQLGVPRKLDQWRDEFDEQGEIERSREQEQVWDSVIGLMDEMVEMVGEEALSMNVYRTTMESGFDSLNFAHVPPSMDHIIVGNVDRSRITGIKCAFLLGVNEGMWPMKPQSEGVISERERELLSESGLALADSSKRQLLDDHFYVYLAFTAAADYLWVSYPLSNEEGKSKTPAPMVKRVLEMFPSIEEKLLLQDSDEHEETERFITTPEKTRSTLSAQLSRYLRGYPMDDIWWDVLHWYMKKDENVEDTKRVLLSLFYENTPENLRKDTAKQLHNQQHVRASVSRLETYYRCSYQHFARYGLGLQERSVYKLDAPDIGVLFHEALKQITEWIQVEGKDWNAITKHDTDQYAERAVHELSPILQHQILHSSNRYQYIQQKLQSVVARAAHMLSEQAKRSQFAPVGLELGFGPDEKIPPLNLDLGNGYELQLRGRIDRVDRALGDEGLLLRIIDYKSSAKGLDLVEVYYGLALQMLAYLDVVLSKAETWLGAEASPAGVLYFHVHNPILSENALLKDADIEEEIFKKFKMQGLLVEDEDIVKMMDTNLESGVSQIVPAGLKKAGGFRKGSHTAEQVAFQELQGYVRDLMGQAGRSITEGEVNLNPYQKDQQVACTHCPFKSVCQFDPTLEENNYRTLKPMKDDEIIETIVRKEEE
ncbi:ATP-dependent helicase [Pontibacillus halophilus JSM 076056 = DSM 19796]|uniref:ATP-dependent helicase/deoxyribonuclease subunit B n=1 Tax=Pontibacillus halophilus JSM 076056 = DSM 19796 TaxID=1385510 RepID=A0A0A5GH98_9BACI|nr:helicase-exonuclease AddAB subunit AddB [Pontibacillus halophilus]KGX92636.1 ATP-dependent helicase [Pontibacillus halophilus JSM 076056 = DSM 19796]